MPFANYNEIIKLSKCYEISSMKKKVFNTVYQPDDIIILTSNMFLLSQIISRGFHCILLGYYHLLYYILLHRC